MANWYNVNPRNTIDARLAYESAGAMGRGIKDVGSAVSGYAKLKYGKKRDKQNDTNLANENSTKVKVANIDYNKSVDTANVKGDADKYVIDGRKGIAKIDYNKSVDTAKIDYRKSANSDHSREKVANTQAKAKVTSSSISADASKYSANVSSANNKRTTSTSRNNSKDSSKTQRYVADKNFEGKKIKAKPKKKTEVNWRVDLLKKAKTPEEREKILSMKAIGDEEI